MMKKQTGFTLIEFMVAMGITLVALAATMVAFKDATNTNQSVTLKSDLSDNLRAGVNLLEQDLIQAGTGIPTGGIPIPYTLDTKACPGDGGAPINRPNLTGVLIFPKCNVSLNAIEPGWLLGPSITSPDWATPGTNTDLITMLYADNTLALNSRMVNEPAIVGNPGCPAGSITSNGQSVTFDATCIAFSPTGVQINSGDLIMFTNGQGNAIQEVTSVNGQTLNFVGGDGLNLNARSDPQGTMVQLELPNGKFPPTTATRIWMITYYLDNVTDPLHVRLIRRVNWLNQASILGQPVGETIENLQFKYNFVDGITNPSGQPSIPVGQSESMIRSVDVILGARSTNALTQTRKYLRSNFMTQVSLRSMAYVNRYK
jgi:prepilin-type N-terminal cleavage/methylation domain-containing protein